MERTHCRRGHEYIAGSFLIRKSRYTLASGEVYIYEAKDCRACAESARQRFLARQAGDTSIENIKLIERKDMKLRTKFCMRGHAMTEENSYHYSDHFVYADGTPYTTNNIRCKTCERERNTAKYYGLKLAPIPTKRKETFAERLVRMKAQGELALKRLQEK